MKNKGGIIVPKQHVSISVTALKKSYQNFYW